MAWGMSYKICRVDSIMRLYIYIYVVAMGHGSLLMLPTVLTCCFVRVLFKSYCSWVETLTVHAVVETIFENWLYLWMSWNIPGVPFGPKGGVCPSSLYRFIDTFVERMLQKAVHYEFRCMSVPHYLWTTHFYAHHSTRSSVVFNVLLFSGILALVQVVCPKPHNFGWCSYTMHG